MIDTMFPPQTVVRRTVPKSTFINQLDADNRMKKHFTQDVERIEWLAKLAPSTINVSDGNDVHEIAVFLVSLKAKECPDDVFIFIDVLMPRHTLFVLTYGDEVCMLVNYKERVSGNTEKKFRITKTYRSAWQLASEMAVSLQGSSMDSLYDNLVRQVAGTKITSDNTNLRVAVEETSEEQARQKEIAALEKKIKLEKQPNKRYALYQQLLKIKKI